MLRSTGNVDSVWPPGPSVSGNKKVAGGNTCDVAFIFPTSRARATCSSLIMDRDSEWIFFILSTGSFNSIRNVSTVRPRNSITWAGSSTDFFLVYLETQTLQEVHYCLCISPCLFLGLCQDKNIVYVCYQSYPISGRRDSAGFRVLVKTQGADDWPNGRHWN